MTDSKGRKALGHLGHLGTLTLVQCANYSYFTALSHQAFSFLPPSPMPSSPQRTGGLEAFWGSEPSAAGPLQGGPSPTNQVQQSV